ncbi:MAG: BatD family protein [Phycisphaeraceae bacterium]|nr:BatD family protein [Phycisphaeraceae bacterium]
MHTRPNPLLPLVFVLTAILAPLGSARAAGPVSVSAELSTTQTYVGDSVQLHVVVDGTTSAEQPVVPGVDGLAVRYDNMIDASQRIQMNINGRVTDRSIIRVVFQYEVTPTRAGVMTIPSIPVTVDGQVYRTVPVSLSAVEPADTDDFKLAVSLSSAEAYVGEPVRLTVTWYVSKPVRKYVFSLPDADGAYDLLPAPSPRPDTVAADDPRFANLTVMGSPVVGTISRATVNGRTFNTITFEQVLIPRKPGSITLGPLRAAFEAIVGQRQRGFFDSIFDDLSVSERFVVSAPKATLAVKPLPSEGRPSNFSGLVGEYSLRADATPTAVNVGDPITVTVTVSGPPPLDLVQSIPIERQRSIYESFKLPSEPTLPQIDRDHALFTYTLRARSDGVKQIPPIELPYFDTKSGEYRVARSDPIPLTVRPTTSLTLGGVPDQSDPALAPTAKPGGLAPLMDANLTLATTRFDLVAFIGRPAFVAAVAAPPTAYLGIAILLAGRRRARRDPAKQRSRNAMRRFSESLASARSAPPSEQPAKVSQAARSLIADLLEKPDGSLTDQECLAVAESAGASTTRLAALLAACDAARFGGGGTSGSSTSLVDEAASIATDLRSEIRRNR